MNGCGLLYSCAKANGRGQAKCIATGRVHGRVEIEFLSRRPGLLAKMEIYDSSLSFWVVDVFGPAPIEWDRLIDLH